MRTKSLKRIHSTVLVSLLLVAATFVAYGQVLHFSFLNYDDPDYVTKNPMVLAGWTWKGLVWAFTSRLHGHWHPLTWLSHMTDCQVFALNPAWHHFTSLLIHIATTLLLFRILQQVTGALWRSAFVAALFALHPLHVESVAWVAERKDVLSAFAWFLTIAAYVHYSKDPKIGRYLLVLACFVLGLMAKAMVVTLPLVLFLMDYWPLDRFRTRRAALERKSGEAQSLDLDQGRRTPVALGLAAEKLALFALTAGCAVVALTVAQRAETRTMDLLKLMPTIEQVGYALVSYVGYIGMMFRPFGLGLNYPYEQPGAWQIVGAGLLLLCITILTLWKGKQYRYLPVGWLWYLITLLPVLGVIRGVPQSIADRYTYLPLTGLSIMISWGIPDLMRRWQKGKVIAAWSAGAVTAGLIFLTWSQAACWKDSVTLFTYCLKVNGPQPKFHNGLGSALMELGRTEEAMYHFSEAIRITPAYPHPYYNVVLGEAEQGQIDQAVSFFSGAIKINPNNAEVRNNLAVALDRGDRVDEAITQLNEALRINPNYTKAHYNLGLMLVKQRKIEEAVRHFSEAIRISPDHAKARESLGEAYWLLGDKASARKQYETLKKLDPNLAGELFAFMEGPAR